MENENPIENGIWLKMKIWWKWISDWDWNSIKTKNFITVENLIKNENPIENENLMENEKPIENKFRWKLKIWLLLINRLILKFDWNYNSIENLKVKIDETCRFDR